MKALADPLQHPYYQELLRRRPHATHVSHDRVEAHVGAHGFRADAGQLVRLTLPEGPQIVDVCVVGVEDPHERYSTGTQMAMEGGRISRGTRIWGSPPRTRPLAVCVADTVKSSGGAPGLREHLAYGAHCVPHMWVRPDGTAERSCHDNLRNAFSMIGVDPDHVGDNLNLFMKGTFGTSQGDLLVARSDAEAGDYIEFAIEVAVHVAISLCPVGAGSDMSAPEEFWDHHQEVAQIRPVEVDVFEVDYGSIAVPSTGGQT